MTKPTVALLNERQTNLRSDHTELAKRVNDVETAVRSINTHMGHIKWAAVASAITLVATQVGIFEALKISLKFL